MDAYVKSGLDRRRFLTGVGGAAVVGGLATVGMAKPARADGSLHAGHRHSVIRKGAAPKPIPQVVPTGLPPDAAPFDSIHWLLPGPPGATTQILGLEAFGLDVDPSLITDYKGVTAYAVVAGTAHGSDGEEYDVEVDVRVMKGRYIDENGHSRHGTFGFF